VEGQTAALEVLIKAGSDVNRAAKNGMTPATVAVLIGHTAALELLVKAGCDVNQADKNGLAPAY
jgi:ankyrin repeat protein